jgi:hypothetical protein
MEIVGRISKIYTEKTKASKVNQIETRKQRTANRYCCKQLSALQVT